MVILFAHIGDVFAIGKRRVPGGIARSLAAWQASDFDFLARAHEIGRGVAQMSGTVDHAVRRGRHFVIRPALEHLTGVDKEMPWQAGRRDPLARGQHQLQPRSWALVKNGDAAVI